MTFTGKMTVFFNRHGAAPLVWSIATAHWEIVVAHIVIDIPIRSRYVPKSTPDDEDGKASAWFECEGTLTIEDGFSIATITPASRVTHD